MPRGPSAKDRLNIDWKYPVFQREVAQTPGGRTVAQQAKGALPLDKAFAYLAGDDPRPLLILRECLVCNGTDDALLGVEADNERTILMLSWFHCVKLPVDVMLEETHPFHALFAGDSPPHLLVADPNGANMRPLESQRSRTELWDVLGEVLKRSYRQKAATALKKLTKLLDKYDVIDSRLGQLQGDLEAAIEKKGPASSKVAKVNKEIARQKAELKKLDREFAKASKLELLRAPSTPANVGN